MIRFGALIFVVLISFTISLPTCNISFWVHYNDTSCSGTPNGTYSAMTYNGNCTLSPPPSNSTSYKLVIDTDTQTVQNFTVYNSKTCATGQEILIGKTPLPLNSCGILYFRPASSANYYDIGTFNFTCQA